MKTLQIREQKSAKLIRLGWGGVVLMCMCLLSLPVQAIWLGQSQVNPYLEVQEVYDSNMYNAGEDEESGLITIISPGVHAEFPNTEDARVRVVGNYRANFKFYDKHGDDVLDPDEELNTLEQRLEGRIEANLSSGFGFGGSYTLNLNSYPPNDPGDRREKYIQHDFMAMTKYTFIDRYELQLEYNGMMRSFEDDLFSDDDITSHGIDATFFYRFSSLALLGGGGYGIIDRQDPPFSDSTEYRGFGGVRFDATSTLTGLAKVGVVSKNFTEDGFEDVTTVYISGQLEAQLTEDTKLVALANREVNDTSFVDTTVGNGEYSIATSIQGNLQHTLAMLPNLTLKGMAEFRKEEYPEDIDERDDNFFEVGAGAEYVFFKYLTLGAEYKYVQLDSSLDEKDYSANRAMVSLRGIL